MVKWKPALEAQERGDDLDLEPFLHSRPLSGPMHYYYTRAAEPMKGGGGSGHWGYALIPLSPISWPP